MKGASAASLLICLAVLPAAFTHGIDDLLHSGCGRVKRNDLQRRQAPGLTTSGEGASPSGTGGARAAMYSCDTNTCRPPACMCASTRPPGNLALRCVAKQSHSLRNFLLR